MRGKIIQDFVKAVDSSTTDNEDRVKVTMSYLRDVCDYIDSLENSIDVLQYRVKLLQHKLDVYEVRCNEEAKIDFLI